MSKGLTGCHGGEDLQTDVGCAFEAVIESQQYKHFDLHLSDEDEATLSQFYIDQSCGSDGMDDFATILETGSLSSEEKLTEFLSSCDKNPHELCSDVAKIILRVTTSITAGLRSSVTYLTIDLHPQDENFNNPGWHVDIKRSGASSNALYKIGFTLIGLNTLFCPLHEPQHIKFIGEHCDHISHEDYVCPSQELPVHGQGSIFIIYSNNSAVHSKPPVNEQRGRMFISIVPNFTSYML